MFIANVQPRDFSSEGVKMLIAWWDISLLVSCFSWLLCFQFASGRAQGRGGRGTCSLLRLRAWSRDQLSSSALVRQKTDGILWPLVLGDEPAFYKVDSNKFP